MKSQVCSNKSWHALALYKGRVISLVKYITMYLPLHFPNTPSLPRSISEHLVVLAQHLKDHCLESVILCFVFPNQLAGDLAKAIRAKTPHVHFGLYHSLYEWFNPLYQKDKAANFTTNTFVMGKTLQELYELVSTLFLLQSSEVVASFLCNFLCPIKRFW